VSLAAQQTINWVTTVRLISFLQIAIDFMRFFSSDPLPPEKRE